MESLRPGLLDLPVEVIHDILLQLDAADLLAITRVCHLLRKLSLDPLLHIQRLRLVSTTLPRLLRQRPTRAAISPPNAWIWLNRTNLLSRSISRSLVKIRLGHCLERRPSIEELVDRAILPRECMRIHTAPAIVRQQGEIRRRQVRDRLGRKLQSRPDVCHVVEMGIMPGECINMSVRVDQNGRRTLLATLGVSPGLVEMRRKVIKESLKDGLRAWVERRGWREQKRREDEWEDRNGGVQSVKSLVRRLSARMVRQDDGSLYHHQYHYSQQQSDRVSLDKKRAQVRWGREVEETRRKAETRRLMFDNGHVDVNQPTRAHVLGLRRFWEGVIKTAAG